MISIIAILSIISIINVFSFNLNAAELDSRNSECLNAAIQFISRISQDLPLFFDWKSAEPINEKYLYDETGKVKKAIIYNVYKGS